MRFLSHWASEDRAHERYLAELEVAEASLKRKKSASISTKDLILHGFNLRLPGFKRLSKQVYSAIVRQGTGETLPALEKMYSSVGMVAAHSKAHQCITRFSSSSVYRKVQILYAASNVWVRITEPSRARSSVVRCLLLFAQLYSKWAVAAVFFNVTALAPDPGTGKICLNNQTLGCFGKPKEVCLSSVLAHGVYNQGLEPPTPTSQFARM